MSNVRDFGAVGDGRHDDTDAIEHTLTMGDGSLEFPPGDYLLTRTITVDLANVRRFGMEGSQGMAKLIMNGPGPAFHLIGSHDRSARPADFQPAVFQRERMPLVENIEIEGRHPDADGFLLQGTMQTTFAAVLLRTLRHGIICRKRARNVLISHCHIYHNTGIGVWFDQVNLHQAIIVGSHISYCAQGGIKITGSEIRNLQITGNDIEYNYDEAATESADVWIDCSATGSTVREGTIASNTIQAISTPGGANVRIIGFNPEINHKAGMLAISGNLIGSQEINVHLVACRGVTVVGNVLYSGSRRNLQLDGSRNIVIGANSFDHNPDYKEKEICTGVRLVDSRDCTLSGLSIHDCQVGDHTVANLPKLERQGLVEIIRCQRINVTGCQLLDGYPVPLFVQESRLVQVTGCQIHDARQPVRMEAALRWQGPGEGNYVSGNTLSPGTQATLALAPEAHVKVGDNLLLERA